MIMSMKTLSCEEELNGLGIMAQRRKYTIEEGCYTDQVEQDRTRVQGEAELKLVYNGRDFTEEVISGLVITASADASLSVATKREFKESLHRRPRNLYVKKCLTKILIKTRFVLFARRPCTKITSNVNTALEKNISTENLCNLFNF